MLCCRLRFLPMLFLSLLLLLLLLSWLAIVKRQSSKLKRQQALEAG